MEKEQIGYIHFIANSQESLIQTMTGDETWVRINSQVAAGEGPACAGRSAHAKLGGKSAGF